MNTDPLQPNNAGSTQPAGTPIKNDPFFGPSKPATTTQNQPPANPGSSISWAAPTQAAPASTNSTNISGSGKPYQPAQVNNMDGFLRTTPTLNQQTSQATDNITNNQTAGTPSNANPIPGEQATSTNAVNFTGASEPIQPSNQGQKTPTPSAAGKPKKSKLPLILGATIPALLLICGLIWYFVIFNNPTNVVKSALLNFATTPNNSIKLDTSAKISDQADVKLSSTIDYDDTKKLSLNITASATTSGMSMDIGQFSIAGDMSNSAYYFKASPSKAINQMVDLSDVSDKWYVLNGKSMGSTSGEQKFNSISTCIGDLVYDGISAKYWNLGFDTHYFQVKQIGSDNNGSIYELITDNSHLTEFNNKFAKSEEVKKVYNCIKQISPETTYEQVVDSISKADSNTAMPQGINQSIKVWVSGVFTKQLNKMEISANATATSGNVNAKIVLSIANKKPAIKLPKSASSISDLMNSKSYTSIMNLSSGLTQQSGSSSLLKNNDNSILDSNIPNSLREYPETSATTPSESIETSTADSPANAVAR